MTDSARERSAPARRRRPLLALALGCALLAALEGGLRLGGWHERTGFFQFQTQLASGDVSRLHVFHPERFFGLATHFAYNGSHAGRFATGGYDGRGRPPLPAPPGMARVVVAGDSCVYGFGLDVAQSLPEALAQALVSRGWGPDQVQVLNRGTSGYSTVQIDLAVEEALERWQPAVVVLYAAAWNDQAPAMGPSDLVLIDKRRGGGLGRMLEDTASVNALRALVGRRSPAPELERDEIVRLWEAGQAPYGVRVPTAAVEQQVRRTLARIAAAGARAVVVIPAHPPDTLARHPSTREDAAAVERAALAAGVPLVDGPEVLAPLVQEGEGRAFLDFVHPSPPAMALLAEALADPVADALGSPPRAQGAAAPLLTIQSVGPARVPALGDVRVTVELGGWQLPAGDLAEVVAVLVGGAPLLDLQRVSSSSVAGTLLANTAGRRDVIVQTARGTAWLPEAIELIAPRFVFEPGPPPRIRLESRPGDTGAVVVAAGALDAAHWRAAGAERLDRERVLFAGFVGDEPLVLDGAAVAQWPREVWLQGAVQPRGTDVAGTGFTGTGVTGTGGTGTGGTNGALRMTAITAVRVRERP